MNSQKHPFRSPVRTALIGLAIILTSIGSAQAADHVNVSSGHTLSGGPLALRGYDPVSYFSQEAPEPGSPDFSVLHDGAVYRFVSAENQAAFEKDPNAYLPAYGGFCAFGVSAGAKFDGDPEVFSIVDGRLYLNLNKKVQRKWSKDVAGNIEKSEVNWEKIRDTAIRDLR